MIQAADEAKDAVAGAAHEIRDAAAEVAHQAKEATDQITGILGEGGLRPPPWGDGACRGAARIVLCAWLVHDSCRKWMGNLGLVLAIVAARPLRARAEEAPRETLDGRHYGHFASMQRRAHHPSPRGIDPGSVSMCPVLRSTPLGACPEPVRVSVAYIDTPSLLDTRRLQAEENAAELLAREIHEVARLRLLRTRIEMLYGIEAEPEKQFQLKREVLVLLAKISADSRIMTAALGVGRGSSLRQLAESEAVRRTHERATFIEIEQLIGPSPLSTTLVQELKFASIGAALFGVGTVTHSFVHKAMGDHATDLEVHPQPWPPGLLIKGSFSVP